MKVNKLFANLDAIFTVVGFLLVLNFAMSGQIMETFAGLGALIVIVSIAIVMPSRSQVHH